MAAHDFLSTFVLGFLVPAAQLLVVVKLECVLVNLSLMHSSEVEVTLVAHTARCPLLPYFWALVRLLGWREAAQLPLLRLLAVLWGAGVSSLFW